MKTPTSGASSGADKDKLQEVNNDRNVNAIALVVEDLLTEFGEVMKMYLVAVQKDPVRQADVEKKAGLWFGNTDAGKIDAYLAVKAAKAAAQAGTGAP